MYLVAYVLRPAEEPFPFCDHKRRPEELRFHSYIGIHPKTTRVLRNDIDPFF